MVSNSKGFTLLEVLIAIAIMVTALATILAIEGSSLGASEKAKTMNTVAMLAKNKMIETELDVEGKSFDEVEKDKGGNFDPPFQDFRWKRSIKEAASTFSAASAGGGGASDQDAQVTDMISKLFSNYLSKALREVTVTVIWQRSGKDQEFEVSTYWVDLNHAFETPSKVLHSQLKEAGFTLLEVLIAICILAFISIGIYQAVTETYRIRETLSSEGDFYNGIRLSMNILQRDLTLVYSPIPLVPMPSPAPSAAAGRPQVQQPSQPTIPPQVLAADPTMGQVSDFWEPALNALNVRLSRFVGTDNKISFVSNSHFRVYKDSAESEFAKVTYELLQDDANKDLKMLVKTENTNVFNMEKKSSDPFERSYALLHGIKTFKYRFYRKDKDEWGPSWDTDKDEFKNMYPDIVELTIEVQGYPRLSFEGRFLFRPEMPLRALNPSM